MIVLPNTDKTMRTPTLADEANAMQNSRVVALRGGMPAIFYGKSFLGRVTVGLDPYGNVMCWNLEGRYRWDGQDDPRDIVDGFRDGA